MALSGDVQIIQIVDLHINKSYVEFVNSFLDILVNFSRVAALPLKRLQSLRDRIPHGVIYIHTTCDYCFVIASMGVRKKRAEALFFLTPIQ